MAKLTIATITSGYSSVATLNANFDLIETAFENTLSRDGTSPNTMGANLDMNSHRVVNVTDATNSADAVNLRQLTAASIVSTLPSMTGHANKVLKTDGTVAGWVTISSQLGSDLTAAADKLPYFNGASTMALADLSAFSRTYLDDANADSMVQTLVAALTAEAGIATDDVVLIGDTSEGKGNKMTVANLWKAINVFTQDTVPDIAADYVATYDASANAPKKVLLGDLAPLPHKYISGLTYANNVGDVVNDLDIAVGAARDATDTVNIKLASAITKRLDANWAVGTNQGGLDTGVIGNNDYYIWLIKRSDTGVVDVLFSLSSTAPTMPTSYDYKRLIGWFKRVGATIVLFHTYEREGGGLEMNWDAPTLDVNIANLLTTSRRTDAVKVPLNFSVIADLSVVVFDAAVQAYAKVMCPDETDAAVTASNQNITSVITSVQNGQQMKIRTSSAGLVAARTNIATMDLYTILTTGFVWARRN